MAKITSIIVCLGIWLCITHHAVYGLALQSALSPENTLAFVLQEADAYVTQKRYIEAQLLLQGQDNPAWASAIAQKQAEVQQALFAYLHELLAAKDFLLVDAILKSWDEELCLYTPPFQLKSELYKLHTLLNLSTNEEEKLRAINGLLAIPHLLPPDELLTLISIKTKSMMELGQYDDALQIVDELLEDSLIPFLPYHIPLLHKHKKLIMDEKKYYFQTVHIFEHLQATRDLLKEQDYRKAILTAQKWLRSYQTMNSTEQHAFEDIIKEAQAKLQFYALPATHRGTEYLLNGVEIVELKANDRLHSKVMDFLRPQDQSRIRHIFALENSAMFENFKINDRTPMLLWHGTTTLGAIPAILDSQKMRKGNRNAFGKGVYTAQDITFAETYAAKAGGYNIILGLVGSLPTPLRSFKETKPGVVREQFRNGQQAEKRILKDRSLSADVYRIMRLTGTDNYVFNKGEDHLLVKYIVVLEPYNPKPSWPFDKKLLWEGLGAINAQRNSSPSVSPKKVAIAKPHWDDPKNELLSSIEQEVLWEPQPDLSQKKIIESVWRENDHNQWVPVIKYSATLATDLQNPKTAQQALKFWIIGLYMLYITDPRVHGSLPPSAIPPTSRLQALCWASKDDKDFRAFLNYFYGHRYHTQQQYYDLDPLLQDLHWGQHIVEQRQLAYTA